MNPTKFAIAVTTLLTCFFSATVAALASDKDQPIHISSDRAERNDKQGMTVYSGSVQMDQGSLRILADKVVIHSIDNQVSKIVATGKPAHYQQQPSQEKQLVIATGNTIEYMIDGEKIHLIENASLRQDDGTTMTGKRINYDIKESVVKAEGDSNSTANNKPDRIHMVIPAKSERQ
ncbi:lipopolysaccharide transport periplasmic protein LptA [Pseudomaricurvus alkylphenolicus]|jgi:lipopolysaccharide export system protein LptA|uniref:lipopolysaccharide transport periplasmic protein LptA n=1 Tax=Pseudomaricurvus alkylphenolicus TaxID=1306991 RepID=UPI001420B861|nr:lipopolysaccharide transport periplasmic protein LptA [Pseudomaricurvus alkylphenolicus]NIB41861.1 lipopolysaccharide transport periplasmic protein LptA [Pseudomaricurvus alkylphenolicus]